MDRISEVWQRTSGVKVIRQALESLKAKQYIEIRQEIPDQELLAIVNEIMPVESPEEAVNVQSVEIVKAVYKSTEDKIKEAVEYCKANGISLTVRNVGKYAGVSKSTAHNYYDLIMKYTD
jgi:hypothetical protein